MTRVLMIDNYDSFTYNIVQALYGLGVDVEVRCNDEISAEEIAETDATHLVVSPGPGRPEDAGVSVPAVRQMSGSIPILGVCLGHQSIAVAFGGSVIPAQHLMHGKTSPAYHDRRSVFAGLPSPFSVGRYHSLAVAEDDLPEELMISSYTSDGEIMGIRHRRLPIEGVQFHPESVLTPLGERLLSNFLEMSSANAVGRSA